MQADGYQVVVQNDECDEGEGKVGARHAVEAEIPVAVFVLAVPHLRADGAKEADDQQTYEQEEYLGVGCLLDKGALERRCGRIHHYFTVMALYLI